MAICIASRCTLLLCFLLFIDVTQATFDDDVGYANVILHDLAASLASPFCSDYIHYQQSTKTCTVTGPAYTVTSTLAPHPCSTTDAGYEHSYDSKTGQETSTTTANPSGTNWNYPTTSAPTSISASDDNDVSTVTSTTTTTYITTSTIWIPAPTSAAKRALLPRQDNRAYDRETWCSDYDVPCRLVQYTPDVISAACGQYLGPAVVTVTTHVWGPQIVQYKDVGCGKDYPADGGEYPAHDESVYHDNVPALSSVPPPPYQQHDDVKNDDETVPEYYTYEDGNPQIPDVELPDEQPSWLHDSDKDKGPAPPVYGFEDGNSLIPDVEVPDEMPAWLDGGNDVKVGARPW